MRALLRRLFRQPRKQTFADWLDTPEGRYEFENPLVCDEHGNWKRVHLDLSKLRAGTIDLSQLKVWEPPSEVLAYLDAQEVAHG